MPDVGIVMGCANARDDPAEAGRTGFDIVRIALPAILLAAAALTRQNSPISMAMIELEPTRAERSAAARPADSRAGASAARPWTEGLIPAEKEWFVRTPAVVLLRDGQVGGGWEGEAPKMEQMLTMLEVEGSRIIIAKPWQEEFTNRTKTR